MSDPRFGPATRRAAAITLLAVSYVLAGGLALFLAQPPGYAAPIWPAAGIALAGALLLGPGAALAVLVGSTLLNGGIALAAGTSAMPAMLLGAGIGTGAALQALVGATLIRRHVHDWRSIEQDGDILRFLAIGGPLASVVSATVALLCLEMAGRIGAGEHLHTWLTWWGGDTLGTMLAAPLVLLLVASRHQSWQPRRLVVTVPVVMVAGLVVALSMRAAEQEVERLRQDFDQRSNAIVRSLGADIEDQVSVLHAIEALFASSDEVDASEFTSFATRAILRHRSLRALGWSVAVPGSERGAFEAAARADGQLGYHITEVDERGAIVPAAERPMYAPLRYVAPLAGHEAAVGFDLRSDPARRAAMDRARDTGSPAATAPLQLVGDHSDRTGVVMFLAIPTSPSGAAAGERPEPMGYVSAGLWVSELVAASRSGTTDGLTLTITDLAATGPEAVLYGDTSADPPLVLRDEPFARRVLMEVGGRRWAVDLAATTRLLAGRDHWEANALMVGGLVLAGLLEVLLLVFSARASAVAQQIEERTEQLSRANLELSREVAERRAAEVALRDAKNAAEAASAAKSEFLANMSHEIRTPMNAIIGMTELALAAPLDADVRDNLTTVRGSAQSLLAIINEILDFSRIEAGRLRLVPQDFDPRALVAECCAMLRSAAVDKGLTLVHEVDASVPATLHGDGGRVRQILVNLLGNAIKFTPTGRVEVALRVEHETGGRVQLALAVRDSGVGIDPSRQRTVFEPFCQGDNSTTREHGGTGLGLTICTRLAALMDGSIDVRSHLGEGSTFTAHLVLDSGQGLDLATTSAVPSRLEPAATALDVLLVEDNAVNQKLAMRLLEKLGHRVTLATNGREAVEATEQASFDLILMDLQMPIMDGMQAFAEIRARQQEGRPRTPVIALTAHAMEEDRRRCMAAGMDGYLPKPFDFREFERTLRDVAAA
ncbi:MAG: CHASE domain-containing protein [Chromatiales bacterium]|nr:CHASE domain-containing protein [Chromatiales bacterium]